jgi:hypothetical protein
MSYIRCTSNPEGLYIYEGHAYPRDRKLYVTIYWTQPKPLSSGKRHQIVVPARLFHEAARRWYPGHKSYKGYYSKDGFSVKEELIYMKTGKKVPAKITKSMSKWMADKKRAEFQIKISHKKEFVFIYNVTWAYVVENVMGTLEYK